MMAAFMPAFVNRAANEGPACPVPMMIASYFSVILARLWRPPESQRHRVYRKALLENAARFPKWDVAPERKV